MKTHKTRAFFLSVCFAGMAFTAYADRVIVTHEARPGADGKYKDVMENHDGGIDALSCEDPGSKFCTWTAPPETSTNKNYDEIKQEVMQQIANGKLTGAFSLDDRVNVTWEAASDRDFTFKINIIE